MITGLPLPDCATVRDYTQKHARMRGWVQDKNLHKLELRLFFVFKRYTVVYRFSMEPENNFLQQLAGFHQMERGTLSVIRQTSRGPCCNLQRRENGRHISEYIPAEQVPLVEANLARHGEFQAVVEQYVSLVCEQSRQERKAGAKKKRPTSASPLPRKPKSKT